MPSLNLYVSSLVLANIFSALVLFSFESEAFVVSNNGVRTATRRHNFFKDMLDQAFQNDSRLSKDDTTSGQIDGSGADDESEPKSSLTPTQEKWQQFTSQVVTPSQLEKTTFTMNFFLTGVPSRDPSNDLFGSRVNISSRDRAVGLTVPKEPTVSGIAIQFLPDNKCLCSTSSPFTIQGEEGDWRLSDDGKQIRFRIKVAGYTRTIETKGTIQQIYWSQENEKKTQTSTTYSIPAGWLYGEARVSSAQSNAGGVAGKSVRWEDCVLKVEQQAGLVGAGTKMVPCGKFDAHLAKDPVA